MSLSVLEERQSTHLPGPEQRRQEEVMNRISSPASGLKENSQVGRGGLAALS